MGCAIQPMAWPGSLPQSQPLLGMSCVPSQCHQHMGSSAVTCPGTSMPTPHLLVKGPLLLFQGSVQCLVLQFTDCNCQAWPALEDCGSRSLCAGVRRQILCVPACEGVHLPEPLSILTDQTGWLGMRTDDHHCPSYFVLWTLP